MAKTTLYKLTLIQPLDGSKRQFKEEIFEAELREDGKYWFQFEGKEAVISTESLAAPVEVTQEGLTWKVSCWCLDGTRFKTEDIMRCRMWSKAKEERDRFQHMVDSLNTSIDLLEKRMIKGDFD